MSRRCDCGELEVAAEGGVDGVDGVDGRGAVVAGDRGEDQHWNRNARLALSVQFSRGAPEAWVLLSGDIRASGHGIGQDHFGIRESCPGA
jgi:hypothetical protein